jgi:hypothetical protein
VILATTQEKSRLLRRSVGWSIGESVGFEFLKMPEIDHPSFQSTTQAFLGWTV